MTIAPTENAPWGGVQWLATGSVTLLASGLAFIWRLMLRLEKLEIAHTTQRAHLRRRAAPREIPLSCDWRSGWTEFKTITRAFAKPSARCRRARTFATSRTA